jgi:hypothetical protein
MNIARRHTLRVRYTQIHPRDAVQCPYTPTVLDIVNARSCEHVVLPAGGIIIFPFQTNKTVSCVSACGRKILCLKRTVE